MNWGLTYKGHPISSNRTFVRKKLEGGMLAKISFWRKVYQGYSEAQALMDASIKAGECYYGPFKGEFGNFLSYVLPFISYLHKQGVKIHYCGMGIHKPLMKASNGENLHHTFFELRDFFKEVSPRTNATVPPDDVQASIREYEQEAKASGLPYWDIGDHFFYWFVLRTWAPSRGFYHTYELDKVYQSQKENSVAIFPRRKGAKGSNNNGAEWDYEELAHAVSPYFDKVYVVGHPAQSLHFSSKGKVEVCISADNSVMLEKVSNSSLIITQHSGTTYIGEYTDTPTLMIYKGDPPIGSLGNTLYFKEHMRNVYPYSFAYSMEEVLQFCENLNSQV